MKLKATIISLVSIFVVGVIAVLLYCYWPAIKGTVDDSKYYTADDLQESYDKGYDDGCKSETELTGQVKYYKGLVDEYYIQVNTLNSEIAMLTTKNNDYKTQITNLSNTRDSLELQVNNLTTIKSDNENTIADLNSQISDLQKQVTILTNNGVNKAEQIEQLNTQIANLQNTVSQLQTTNDMNLQTITSLNTQIANLNTQISDMTMQSQNSTSQINALNNRINELQESINYYESYIASLETSEQVVATFEFDGSVYNIQIVNKGAKVSVVDPTSTDYVIFNYWTVDGEQIDLATYTLSTNTKIIANVTYKYDVKFVVDNANYDSQVIIKDGYVTVPSNPTKDGYEFDGWTLNGVDVISNINTTAVTQNITYTAKFTKLHTVTFVVDGETVDTQIVRNGNYVTTIPSVDSTDNKTFNYWTVNNTYVDLTQYPIVGDVIITAYFTYSYNVNFMVNNSTYDTQVLSSIDDLTIPENPTRDGYDFKGWSLNGIDVISNIDSVDITRDTYFYAVFEHQLSGRWRGTSNVYGSTGVITSTYIICLDIYHSGMVHIYDTAESSGSMDVWTYITYSDGNYTFTEVLGCKQFSLVLVDGKLYSDKTNSSALFGCSVEVYFDDEGDTLSQSYITNFVKKYRDTSGNIYNISMRGNFLFVGKSFISDLYKYCVVVDGVVHSWKSNMGITVNETTFTYELTDEYIMINNTVYTFVE